MKCPRCKKFVGTLMFCATCGIAALSGHAEEPPHSKWYPPQEAQTVIMTTSTTATPTVRASDWRFLKKPSS